MRYRYRCAVCRTTSPAVPTRRAVEAERDTHRDRIHGGHTPDGEQITGPPPPTGAQLGCLAATVLVLLLLALAHLLL